jgi:hypothetical protein
MPVDAPVMRTVLPCKSEFVFMINQ